MDPVSVAGLIASCCSIIKICGGVVHTLHSINETYKDADISIVAALDECENIRMSWGILEMWISKNRAMTDYQELLFQRLQSSICAGEKIMVAFEQELNKVVLEESTLKRKAAFTWNDSIFHVHLTRIGRQTAALQVLLQAVCMPRIQDREDTVSVKDHVFQEIDECASSITSSPLMPQKTGQRSDWFRSMLSKRNHRPPQHPSTVKYAIEYEGPENLEQQILAALNNIGKDASYVEDDAAEDGSKGESNLATTEDDDDLDGFSHSQTTLAVPLDHTEAESETQSTFAGTYGDQIDMDGLTLSLEIGVEIFDRDCFMGPSRKKAMKALETRRFSSALRQFKKVDIAWIFHPSSNVSFTILEEFLLYTSVTNRDFLVTALERLALSAGASRLRRLRAIHPGHPLSTREQYKLSLEDWERIESAAVAHDFAHNKLEDQPCDELPLLLLAGAGLRNEVVDYLLRTGFPRPQAIYFEFAFFASLFEIEWPQQPRWNDPTHSPPINYILILLGQPKDNWVRWFCNGRVTEFEYSVNMDHALFGLLEGLDLSAPFYYLPGQELSLLHYLIAEEAEDYVKGARFEVVLERALELGADPDIKLELVWQSLKFPYMSPLAYAILLGRRFLVRILLEHGATAIWPEFHEHVGIEVPGDFLIDEDVRSELKENGHTLPTKSPGGNGSKTYTVSYVDLVVVSPDKDKEAGKKEACADSDE